MTAGSCGAEQRGSPPPAEALLWPLCQCVCQAPLCSHSTPLQQPEGLQLAARASTSNGRASDTADVEPTEMQTLLHPPQHRLQHPLQQDPLPQMPPDPAAPPASGPCTPNAALPVPAQPTSGPRASWFWWCKRWKTVKAGWGLQHTRLSACTSTPPTLHHVWWCSHLSLQTSHAASPFCLSIPVLHRMGVSSPPP